MNLEKTVIKIKPELTPSQVFVLGFLIVIMIGAYLLQLPASVGSNQSISWIDALFTATSATCVTGLIVLDTGNDFSLFGQWIILFLIQIGGLGVMTFSTMFAFLLGRKISLKQRLIIQTSLNQFSIGGLIRFAKYILLFTFFFEGLGTLFLYFSWMKYPGKHSSLFLSLFHSVSAFCNAGFSLFPDSLEGFGMQLGINIVMIILIVFGGIGFLVLVELYEYPKRKKISLHTKIVILMTVSLIILGTLGFYGFERENIDTIRTYSFQGQIFQSVFQSITARTAGFNTVPIGKLEDSTLLLLMVFMFIGASPTSTGGGIKTTTFCVAFLWMYYTLIGRRNLYLFQRQISREIVNKSWAIIMLAMSWIFSATLFLTIFEDFPFIDLLFEVISAFGTVGLSRGLTPVLSVGSKLVIILTMFVGRLGPIAIALSLITNPHKELIQYPEGHIMVG